MPGLIKSLQYPPQENNETIIRALRLLLSDDNPDVAHSLATWLELAGHQVKIASTGDKGILAAVNFKPDIVFLDIGLPDMNGYEVARKLRELPEGKNLYLICLSGYAPKPDKSGQNAHGFDHYLIKPPQINQLRQLIADYQITRQALENC